MSSYYELMWRNDELTSYTTGNMDSSLKARKINI